MFFLHFIYSGMRRKKNMDQFENKHIANEKISKPLIEGIRKYRHVKKCHF